MRISGCFDVHLRGVEMRIKILGDVHHLILMLPWGLRNTAKVWYNIPLIRS